MERTERETTQKPKIVETLRHCETTSSESKSIRTHQNIHQNIHQDPSKSYSIGIKSDLNPLKSHFRAEFGHRLLFRLHTWIRRLGQAHLVAAWFSWKIHGKSQSNSWMIYEIYGGSPILGNLHVIVMALRGSKISVDI
jgi:hypothetical protein